MARRNEPQDFEIYDSLTGSNSLTGTNSGKYGKECPERTSKKNVFALKSIKNAKTKKKPDFVVNMKNKNEIEQHTEEMTFYREVYLNSAITAGSFSSLSKLKKEAVKERKIFAAAGGSRLAVEKGLKKRGWIKKSNVFWNECFSENASKKGLRPARVRCHDVGFLWCYEPIAWHRIPPSTIVSSFPDTERAVCTKLGLSRSLKNLHWVQEQGVSDVLYPRTFVINCPDELLNFSDEYRMTACVSTLSYVVDKGFCLVREFGEVSFDMIDFAIRHVCEYINYREHADIDMEYWPVEFEPWSDFIEAYYYLVHRDGKLKRDPTYNIQSLFQASKKCLEVLKPYWADLSIDGYNNVWIVKPGASNQGRGIQVMNRLEDILASCAPRKNFIIQKYIEKPLLIHSTKFDIRQWFLLTSVYPLELWMYDRCYLRFSSQEFSLDHFHESIHLCNNSVQYKYKNAKRSEDLPEENMWESEEFEIYLKELGLYGQWTSVSVPKMGEAVVGALLSAQGRMRHRPNSFALYGADFVLTEELIPWLLEINSGPAMGPSTRVTARMCTDVTEDILKVVLDRKSDILADTGGFRLLYRQRIFKPAVPSNEVNLTVHGEKIKIKKKPEELNEGFQNMKSSEWRSIKYEELAQYRCLKNF